MIASSSRVPTYRHYKPKNLAVVRIAGKDIYLGAFDSPESRRRYHEVVAKHLAGDTCPLSNTATPSHEPISIKRLCLAYFEFAEGYYVKSDRQTTEVECIRQALRRLLALFGDVSAEEFGPKALKMVRDEYVRSGQARGTVNNNVSRLKRMFRWAAENELIPVAVYQAVATVTGLKKGRSPAREPENVLPVSDADVEAALPFMPVPIQAMVQLQRLTGCRPGEICVLRTGDLNRTGEVWCFRLGEHKTAHHDLERRIYFGPKAQAVLTPWLEREASSYCFSPAEEVARQQAAKHAARKTPLNQGNRPGLNRKAKPKRTPKDRYTTQSYRRAIERACKKAKIGVWSPNQLRHTRATELRRLHGLEAAKTVLGHTELLTTQIYAERDFAKAEAIMREVG